MERAERALVPYRVRAVRIGIQCSVLTLALLLVFRLLPGSGPISWTPLLVLLGIAACGTVVALLLPWGRLFEGPWGLRIMYAWSVADIVLISVALVVTGMHNPNLFLLYAFTTLFFAACYPMRSQLLLFFLTVVAYLIASHVSQFDESIANTVFKLGSLALIGLLGGFLSQELMRRMMHVSIGLNEAEGAKNFYESLLQAQSDMGEGVSIIDIQDNRIVYVNDAICQMLGYSRDELVGMSGMSNLDLLPPDERAFVGELRAERQRTGEPLDYHQDFRLVTKDGRLITVETVSKPLDERRVVSITREVTAQRKAESALRERKELLQAASEITSGFVFSLRVEEGGRLVGEWVTDGFWRMSGFPADSEAAVRWVDAIHPDDYQRATDALLKLFRGADFVKVPLRVMRVSGDVRHIETFGKAVWNEDGSRVVRIYGMVQDVTEHRLAEDALLERANVLEAISELSSDYAYSVALKRDGTYELEWVTDAVERVTGYTPEQLTSNSRWLSLIHPEDQAIAGEMFGDLLRGPSRSRAAELRLIRNTGEVRDILVRARSVWDETGERMVRVSGSVEDITEAKKADAALKASEQKYRSLFDRLPLGLFLRTPEGVGLDANPACIAMFGYPDKDSFLAADATSFYVNPTDREKWLRAIEVDDPRAMEFRFRRRDGSTFWGSQTARAVRDQSGEVIFFEGAIEDVSERKAMQREQEASLSLLRATLESTWDGVLVVDLEGRIVEANERFGEMWQIPKEVLDARDDEQALNYVLENLSHPEKFLARVHELYRAPAEESFDVIEFKDGRVFERFSRPQRIDHRIVGRVWSFRDVTERAQLQEQLLQAQKMEAVGRLAGGVAHDFNNLLTAILGYCELILTSSETSEATRSDVEEIDQAAKMGAGIAEQLLDVSRRRMLRPEAFDLNGVVSSMEPMLRRLGSDNIILETDLSNTPCMVEADRSQIEQVILNLVVNAGDAMPRGGGMRIATKTIEVSGDMASKSLRLSPGRHALLTVSDSGHGIEPEIKDRIFEPFFTTRTGSRGTGLGLSTLYGIVGHYNGHVEVDSEVGVGTTFSVFLPESIAQPIPIAMARAATRWLSGSERVLLVEDDPSVRRLARRALERYGYSLIEAESGGKALKLVDKLEDHIDIVVTDVIMPGMDGRQLADKLLLRRPDLKILYMSGYTGEALARFGDLRVNEDFIPKPFRPDELVAKARELLNQSTDPRAEGVGDR